MVGVKDLSEEGQFLAGGISVLGEEVAALDELLREWMGAGSPKWGSDDEGT